ncbi:unnamed protein product [Amoebophrya sp. A25]|nr:unnamed protein product [Amoebophrya sp. A25]|eukprot:GSA25T00002341001.1
MPDSGSYFPIAELTPYNRNWTIKARVMTKSTLRPFNRINGGGKGSLFSVDLEDKEGDQIRATFYNEVAEKFINTIESSKVYTFSKGTVKVANKAYNTVDHDYEVSFNQGVVVEESADDGSIGTNVRFNFVDLRSVKSRALPCNIDVVGVVSKVEESRTWQRDGKEFTKYAFTVVDETETELEVSLFASVMDKYPPKMVSPPDDNPNQKPIVAMKGVVVKEFQGRSGVLNDSGVLVVNPHLDKGPGAERAQAVSSWWEGGGSKKAFTSMRELTGIPGVSKVEKRTLAELVDEVEPSAGPDRQSFKYSEVYARLNKFITERKGEKLDMWYNACPEKVVREGAPANSANLCNKKVVDGMCRTHGMVNPYKRWNCRVVFQDAFGDTLLTLFDEHMTKISSETAEDAVAKRSADALDSWYTSLCHRELYKMRLQTKQEAYEGEMRAKTTIMAIEPVNRVSRGEEMMKEIEELRVIDDHG